jgi:hypothetical protein
VYVYKYTHTYKEKLMSCECFNNCNYCTEKDNCPHDLKGDGLSFCHEFVCNVDECKRSFCIDRKEEK